MLQLIQNVLMKIRRHNYEIEHEEYDRVILR